MRRSSPGRRTPSCRGQVVRYGVHPLREAESPISRRTIASLAFLLLLVGRVAPLRAEEPRDLIRRASAAHGGGEQLSQIGASRIGVTADSPVVLLTPYWDGQGEAVGFIETLERVKHDGFRLVSGNAAENDYVSWVAVGRKGR